MSTITAHVRARLGDFALDVELELPGRGVTALFGHSGSGKTTLLRAIAGLERFEGHLKVNGESWQNTDKTLAVHKRPIGYVFQEASLFAHLNVEQNLAFGLRRVPAASRRIEMQQAVEWLGLTHLLRRAPARLSGGERQRVAIARALLTTPELLLMDEPLAALDEQSKQEILPYLERLHEHLAIPVLYVSHSLSEVARLADHMVWLESGRVRQQGPLQEVLGNMKLATQHGEEAVSVMDTTVAEHDKHYHLTALDSRFGRLWVRQLERVIGTAVRVSIPARDVSLSLEREQNSSILNVWEAEVVEISSLEHGQVLLKLCCPQQQAGKEPLLCRITQRSCDQLGLVPGSRVFARIKSVGLLE
ncbi:MAG: molybdenum ABC transporter ATP-binding protein [Gammaproteobacteria bacterium]|nr:molybdenum ABC transporter ATP-binding protein [Gammaproteobacteria bacterium]